MPENARCLRCLSIRSVLLQCRRPLSLATFIFSECSGHSKIKIYGCNVGIDGRGHSRSTDGAQGKTHSV